VLESTLPEQLASEPVRSGDEVTLLWSEGQSGPHLTYALVHGRVIELPRPVVKAVRSSKTSQPATPKQRANKTAKKDTV
jgi:hypothetical protein